MQFVLVIVAVMLALLLGWLLKQSFSTVPWVPAAVEDGADRAPLGATAKLIALTTFLAVVTSFFALILSAYGLRMEFEDWVPLHEPVLLWVNTALLVAASLAFQWTRNAAILNHDLRLKPGLIVTGALTIAFLLGQVAAWWGLNASGHYLESNPANAFFYMLTALHALHILGGLYVWGRATARVLHGADAFRVRQSIELCTVYWHFLLLVWLVLFALLLST